MTVDNLRVKTYFKRWQKNGELTLKITFNF